MSNRDTLMKWVEQLNAISSEWNKLESLDCHNKSGDGKSCIARAHELGLNREGKTRFWYGADCSLPARTFCNVCLFGWIVATASNVARNLVATELS